MARQSTSGRGSGSTATKNVPGNQTPNTPDINESEIARLKVDQLRDRLRRRGITGTGEMRKDDLVKALIKALREGRKTTRARAGGGSRGDSGSGSRRGAGSSDSGPGRSGTGSRPRAGSRARSAGAEQPGNQTPNTPDINESEIARLKVDQLRDRLRRRGITGTGEMRKDDLVKALIKALREGRKTTRSGSGSGSGSASKSGPSATSRRGSGSGSGSKNGGTARSGSGSSAARGRTSGEQPGNQTPNTPEINESAIARLTVDELRAQLRRHGVTGTAGMRKPELVDALIRALAPDADRRRAAERRATGGADHAPEALPAGPVHAELPAGPAPDALAAAAAQSEQTPDTQREVRIPRPRTAPHDIQEAPHRQPVRSPEPPTGSGPSVTAETADRVLTDLVPAEMEPVDEVVTPEGTVITAVDETVASPPLPGTER